MTVFSLSMKHSCFENLISSRELAMSLLKSIRTSSTVSIMFLSVTLKPLINFDNDFFI